jgi:hypothetical protein
MSRKEHGFWPGLSLLRKISIAHRLADGLGLLTVNAFRPTGVIGRGGGVRGKRGGRGGVVRNKFSVRIKLSSTCSDSRTVESPLPLPRRGLVGR